MNRERTSGVDIVEADIDAPQVSRARRGDQEALGELFTRHAPAVRRLLTRLIGPNQDQDDLVQEVFLQVHRSLPRFRGESRFTTWLHQLTVYAAYNYLRKPRSRYVSVDPGTFLSSADEKEADAYERLVGKETLRRLYGALEKIKPKKRLAFMLFAVEGMSVNEVAEVVDATVPTVKSRIWFARRELLKKARQDPYLGQLLEEMGEDGSLAR